MKNEEEPAHPRDHRERFIKGLYRLGDQLDSENRYIAAEARKTLARLRRSLTDERHVIHGYEFLLPYEVPPAQEARFLLLAGLFALSPCGSGGKDLRRSLCSALADAGSKDTAEARVRQLIAASKTGGIDYRLRQAVQLIGGARTRIPLDYSALLNDLLDLEHSEEKATQVRLRWARDFQHRVHTRTSSLEPDVKGSS